MSSSLVKSALLSASILALLALGARADALKPL
jgi:hypothetical protein